MDTKYDKNIKLNFKQNRMYTSNRVFFPSKETTLGD